MKPRRPRLGRRCETEPLEARVCLSASLVDGVLAVQGTDRSDNIRVVGQGATIVVRDRDGVTSFSTELVEEVAVDARGGNDRVRLSRLDIPAIVDGKSGNDVIIGGDEDDLFRGGDGNDRLRGNDGGDVLLGEAGDDRISGDFGDDDLSGGPGFDRLSGGPGLDLATDLNADLFNDLLLSVEEVPGLAVVSPTTADATLLPDTLLRPFDTSLFFGSPLFGNALAGTSSTFGSATLRDRFGNNTIFDPVTGTFAVDTRFSDPRFGLASPTATQFLTRDRFFTAGDLTGVTPTSGGVVTDARLPGFTPVDQPIVFPGYVAFPETSFIGVVPPADTIFGGSTFTGSTLTGSSLAGSNFAGSNFAGSTMTGSTFTATGSSLTTLDAVYRSGGGVVGSSSTAGATGLTGSTVSNGVFVNGMYSDNFYVDNGFVGGTSAFAAGG